MKHSKLRLFRYLAPDAKAMEAELDRMARSGWALRWLHCGLACFRRTPAPGPLLLRGAVPRQPRRGGGCRLSPPLRRRWLGAPRPVRRLPCFRLLSRRLPRPPPDRPRPGFRGQLEDGPPAGPVELSPSPLCAGLQPPPGPLHRRPPHPLVGGLPLPSPPAAPALSAAGPAVGHGQLSLAGRLPEALPWGRGVRRAASRPFPQGCTGAYALLHPRLPVAASVPASGLLAVSGAYQRLGLSGGPLPCGPLRRPERRRGGHRERLPAVGGLPPAPSRPVPHLSCAYSRPHRLLSLPLGLAGRRGAGFSPGRGAERKRPAFSCCPHPSGADRAGLRPVLAVHRPGRLAVPPAGGRRRGRLRGGSRRFYRSGGPGHGPGPSGAGKKPRPCAGGPGRSGCPPR